MSRDNWKQRNPVVEYWVAEGDWVAETGLRCGGDPNGHTSVDLALARDAGGRFYIPGASLAGASRSFLARTTSGDSVAMDGGQSPLRSGLDRHRSGAEPLVLWALFGGYQTMQQKRPAYASLLSVDEAVCENASEAAVRDGVAIDAETGLAADKAKFDAEVLPAGAKFHFRLELGLPEAIPYSDVSRKSVLLHFRWILESLKNGDLRLGAKTHRGLGSGRVAKWEISSYDLRKRDQALRWLRKERNLAALEDLETDPLPVAVDRLKIVAKFQLVGPILVRGRSKAANSPDMVHFQEADSSWLPGSSLTGALRHRVRRIAAVLFPDLNPEAFVREMFGIANVTGEDPRSSRVSISESKISNGLLRVQSRVTIDRFTGGAIETALFDQAPLWPMDADHHLVTEWTLDADPSTDKNKIQALLAAFKDLWLEDLPVGGEVSVGRGVLRGVHAVISYTGLPTVEISRTGEDGAVQVKNWTQVWNDLTTVALDKKAEESHG